LSGLVVITGATGGIGRATAMAVAAAGHVPVIGYRRGKEKIAHDTAQACNGLTLELEMMDATMPDSVVRELVRDARQVHGLVLAASPPPTLSVFGKIDAAEHELYWKTNVVGSHRLLAAITRECLRPHRKGSVVAVLSKAMGSPESPAMRGMGAYTISKFGLSGVLALLKAEYHWLNVASVSPTFTDTEMMEAFDPRFVEQLRARGEIAQPSEVAREILAALALPPA
jgi:NAD(P)-dependent dehydrogenase (short-subunit alcohol dehydrogenase family)